MVGEEADLPAGAIGDLVLVPPRREHDAGIADADPRAVGQGFDARRLRTAIARHAHDTERHAHLVPCAITVARRKVAQDAAPDLAPLRLHCDALGDEELAARLYGDRAVEIQHLFFTKYFQRKGEKCENQEPLHIDTFVAARSSVSKNGIGSKRNALPMIMSGKDSRRVTYCFTAPL